MKEGGQRLSHKIVAVVVAAAASIAVLAPGLLINRRGGVAGPMQPPWRFPAAASQTMKESPVGPAAVIYVDRACVHCKAELALWERVLAHEGAGFAAWVIASPQSEMDGASWVPATLRPRTIKDEDGTIARTLKVRAVPVTFWVDGLDTVRTIDVGRSPRSRVIDNIKGLTEGRAS